MEGEPEHRELVEEGPPPVTALSCTVEKVIRIGRQVDEKGKSKSFVEYEARVVKGGNVGGIFRWRLFFSLFSFFFSFFFFVASFSTFLF
jgi:hypothetical protein